MPYIQCPDGQTYSRYDNSPYVVWCIHNEDSIANAKWTACLADPKCIGGYKHKENIAFTICLISIIILILIIRLISISR